MAGGDGGKGDGLLACLQKALGHALPNQLVATQGLLRLLEQEEGPRLSPEGQDYLRRVVAAAQRSHALITELAELVRAVRNVEPPAPVDPAELATEVSVEVRKLFADRPLDFHLDVQVPRLLVPPRGFRQVLLRLVRAVVPEAGEVAPRVEVSAAETAAGVELRVSSSGPGWGPQQQQQLFEPFAPGGEGSGEGLGLLLARTLVEGWGGRVQLDPGRGRCLLVTLPAAQE